LLRAYWYVTENIDFHPWKIPHPWENKRRLFRRSPDLRVRLDAIEGDDRDALKDIANQLDDKRAIMKVGSRAGKRSRIQ
jgi:DNA-directed RNA polymerase subunit L